MRRWHEEVFITKRNWLTHRRFHVEANLARPKVIGGDPFVVDCECDEQMGRFRKKDAYDCGNTQCYMCHGDKFPKRTKTRQEEVADLSFKEQLSDLEG